MRLHAWDLLVGSLLAASVLTLSIRDAGGAYVAGAVGYVLPHEVTDQGVTTDHGGGVSADLGGGWQLGEGFRLGADIGYLSLDPRHLTATNGAVLSSSLRDHSYTFAVEGYYDLDLGGGIAPYIGGGLGLARTDFDRPIDLPFLPITCVISNPHCAGPRATSEPAAATDLLWRAEAGVAFRVAGGLEIVPAYRHEQSTGSGAALLDADIFEVGLRWSF